MIPIGSTLELYVVVAICMGCISDQTLQGHWYGLSVDIEFVWLTSIKFCAVHNI